MTTNNTQESKNYKWSPEDKIEITGLEYDIMQKTISIFDGAAAFKAASDVRSAILKRMIDQGIAKEFEIQQEGVDESIS